ncbi:hypothetical protein Shal_2060 [Shewanella halifaxensis HAW-EB4]|uniref:Uncharacterized protein n=1 Tax=Shewanella halifaxensis (strain HAW-EB4) TaxID=458817 RepID=B0TT60_SHEHH|nr:hypothetical protein Shal_2060 [Shewanella halifaxensis HAW-EB4]
MQDDINFKLIAGNRYPLWVKSRYSAGLVCQDRGWEFCATWAKSKRSPDSRIA